MPDDSLKFLQEEARRLSDENRDLRDGLRALQESVHVLSELYAIAQTISPQTDVLGLLSDILDTSLAVLKASDGSLMLADDETGELAFAVVRGQAADRLVGYRIPREQGIAGWVATHRQPQIVLDVRRDPRFFARVDELFDFKTRSMVCVPVFLDEERVMGVIEVLNKVSDREFTQDDLHLMMIVAQLAAVAIHRTEKALASHEQRQAARAKLLKQR